MTAYRCTTSSACIKLCFPDFMSCRLSTCQNIGLFNVVPPKTWPERNWSNGVGHMMWRHAKMKWSARAEGVHVKQQHFIHATKCNVTVLHLCRFVTSSNFVPDATTLHISLLLYSNVIHERCFQDLYLFIWSAKIGRFKFFPSPRSSTRFGAMHSVALMVFSDSLM